MATILDSPVETQQKILINLSDFFNDEDIDNDDENEYEVPDHKEEHKESKQSIWIKQNDEYRGSVNISLQKIIPPGIYTVNVDREGYYCEKSVVKSDELFLFSDALSIKILEEIELFWSSYNAFKEKNLIHKRGILLEGPAGTGKSSIVTMLSSQIISNGGIVFKISDMRNFIDYVGFLHSSFRKIQPTTPIITILEDIDKFEEIMPSILDFLDGKNSIDYHVFIATTNNSEALEDNLIRPSRLDLVYTIDLPCKQHREEFFKFKKVPDEDLDLLVSESEHCSLADLKEIYICKYLLGYSIEDAISKVKSPRQKVNYLKRNAKKIKIGL